MAKKRNADGNAPKMGNEKRITASQEKPDLTLQMDARPVPARFRDSLPTKDAATAPENPQKF